MPESAQSVSPAGPTKVAGHSIVHLPAHVQQWIAGVIDDPAVHDGLLGFENLRAYQWEAVMAAAARVLKTVEPLLITLPTGAGKSWVIAALASVLRSMVAARTGKPKKVLVLAHSKELVQQNADKMVSAGYNATIYAAGLKQRDASGDIVFGSRQTVINALDELNSADYEFAAVFVDEAHSMPAQTQQIIDALRQINSNLRVIGLTATPYALGKGYVFARDSFRALPALRDTYTRNPYFAERVYDKCPHELIDDGYLSPPVLGAVSDAYNVEGLERTVGGGFSEASNNKVFVEGQENLTKRIVKEVKDKAKTRNGCMFFAQNREHAAQILSFLPKRASALVDSKTKAKDRDRIIGQFKAGKLKYLVTVQALSTGFDAPNVDLIAVLRHTESQALFQQIIGRGLRLCPEIGKKDCLILDYARNLPPDGDLFTPIVELGVPNDAGGSIEMLDVVCPDCGGNNQFRKAAWPSDTDITPTGFLYYLSDQKMVVSADNQPVAGHLGTQCQQWLESPDDQTLKRCTYTWGSIICPRCERRNSHRNDFCHSCEMPLSRRAKMLTMQVSRDEHYAHRLVRVVHGSGPWLFPGRSASRGAPTLRISLAVQELPYLVPADPPTRGRKRKDDEDVNKSQERWLPHGLQMVRPEPFKLTAWLNPTIKNVGAQTSWQAFMRYAQGHQLRKGDWSQYKDASDLLSALADDRSELAFEMPRYLIYQKNVVTQGKDSEEKVFFNLVSLHKDHPEQELVNSRPKRESV